MYTDHYGNHILGYYSLCHHDMVWYESEWHWHVSSHSYSHSHSLCSIFYYDDAASVKLNNVHYYQLPVTILLDTTSLEIRGMESSEWYRPVAVPLDEVGILETEVEVEVGVEELSRGRQLYLVTPEGPLGGVHPGSQYDRGESPGQRSAQRQVCYGQRA